MRDVLFVMGQICLLIYLVRALVFTAKRILRRRFRRGRPMSSKDIKRSEWKHAQPNRCTYCNQLTKSSGIFLKTVDHIIPKSRGGFDSEKNWVIACRRCNADKGNLTAAEYLVVKKYRAAEDKKPRGSR